MSKQNSHFSFRSFSVGAAIATLTALPVWAMDLPTPLTLDDFAKFDAQRAELGQLLFYDKILSGNKNIACATCHHHSLGSADGLSLGIGEGGVGLGQERTAGIGADEVKHRVPRNAPALWNLAYKDVSSVFHDGRLSVSDIYGSGFDSPAKDKLPIGLETIIAAQALFPPTSAAEMAGQEGENDVADATKEAMHLVWPILAQRVSEIPEYVEMFEASFDTVKGAEDITMVEIANAIAAFVGTEWRNFDSPFDKYLAGDDTALNASEMAGMEAFFGDAGCSSCHSGQMFSDQEFHAIGLPQFGPGRTKSFDPVPRDIGLLSETGNLDDVYRFKTPFLRNIALTGPYGHNGAMPTLEDMVRHHFDPVGSRAKWSASMAILPPAAWLASSDFAVLDDLQEMTRQVDKLDIALPSANEQQIADIVAFLHALTGETAETRPLGRPNAVPSGLSVD